MKLLVLTLFFVSNANAVIAKEVNEVEKCLGSLTAYEEAITKNRPLLSSRYVIAKRGFASMMNESTIEPYSEGRLSDISSCIGLKGVTPSDLDLLVKAYHGALSDNPYDDVTSCYAGFILSLQSIDEKLSEDQGEQFGFIVGVKIGRLVSNLSYLYKAKALSLDEVEAKAFAKARRTSQEDGETQKRELKKYLDTCDWYGVPARDAVKVLNIR